MSKLIAILAVCVLASATFGQAVDVDFTAQPAGDTTDLGWVAQDDNRDIGPSLHYAGDGDTPNVLLDNVSWQTELAPVSGIDFRPADDMVNFAQFGTIHEDLSLGVENGSGFNVGFADSDTGFSYNSRVVLSDGASQPSYQSRAEWQPDQGVVGNPGSNDTGDFSAPDDNGLVFEHATIWRPILDDSGLRTMNLEMYRKAPGSEDFSKFVDGNFSTDSYGEMPDTGTIDNVTVGSKGRSVGGGQVEGTYLTAGETGQADFNLDGSVTSQDANIWVGNEDATGAGLLEGDANNDGSVTGQDANIWVEAEGTQFDTELGNAEPLVEYDYTTGLVSVEADDEDLMSIILLDSPATDSVISQTVENLPTFSDMPWDAKEAVNGDLEWTDPGFPTSAFAPLTSEDGKVVIGTLGTDLGEADFGQFNVATAQGSNLFGDVTVVPEPATMALLGLGGLGALARRRRG